MMLGLWCLNEMLDAILGKLRLLLQEAGVGVGLKSVLLVDEVLGEARLVGMVGVATPFMADELGRRAAALWARHCISEVLVWCYELHSLGS